MFQVLVFICVQMLQNYVVQVDLEVAYIVMAIHTYLKSICFKCFIRFDLYVANVLFLCFKSRPGVTHVAIYVGG
jgi:cell wall-associated NlpC family hydrolase